MGLEGGKEVWKGGNWEMEDAMKLELAELMTFMMEFLRQIYQSMSKFIFNQLSCKFVNCV